MPRVQRNSRQLAQRQLPEATVRPPAPTITAVPTLLSPGLPVGARIENLPPQTPMATAVSSLTEAGQALLQLAERLPDDQAFTAVVQLLLQRGLAHGRVVVTGVGKSSHIGGKIAATLASTGTPAYFVHPTEALHGDLGMITAEDTLLALSHTGESKELAGILSYCQRFKIPLIALTGRPSSTLGRAATHILNTGVLREACPLNLAPTTSSTTSLGLADALAVALMTARGFGAMDFAIFHPGGKLGAQLLRVSDIMLTENLPLLPETARMHELLLELTQKNVGCVGFLDAEGRLSGIFTDGDLKRRLLASEASHTDLMSLQATDVMTRKPKTIAPEAMAVAGIAQFQQGSIKDLWVIDEAGKPLGLFRLDACLARGVV